MPALTLPLYELLIRTGAPHWAYDVARASRESHAWRWRPTATPQGLYGHKRLRTYHVRGRIEQSAVADPEITAADGGGEQKQIGGVEVYGHRSMVDHAGPSLSSNPR